MARFRASAYLGTRCIHSVLLTAATVMAAQQQAVAQAKQAKEPAAGFQQTLRKMKAGTLQ